MPGRPREGSRHWQAAPEPVAANRSWLDSLLMAIGVGSAAGGMSGLLWGGVGGRVAMRVVLLTSDDRVRGLTSDDGFEIGRLSAATIALLIFTTILGAIAGSVVGVLKILLGRSLTQTALAVGVASAAVGGSLLVHSDGVDFRLLEPLWLTVGLFVFIPGAWGITAVLLMDRLSRPDGLHGANQSLRDAPIGKRIGIAVGWAVLLLLTGIGVWGLERDISQLT